MKFINIKSIKKSFSWVMIFSLMVQLLIGILPVYASDTGLRPPSAVISNSGWVAPTAVYSSDNLGYAVADSSADIVQYGSFNFGVPAGATINGVEISVEGATLGIGTRQADLSLSWNNGTEWTGVKTTNQPRAIMGEATRIFGSSTDIWGRVAWNYVDFSNTNFRLKIDANNASTGGGILMLDSVAAKVYYTEDTTAPTAYLDFYEGTGPAATSFRVHFSEPIKSDEVEDSSNYYLKNWPNASVYIQLNDNGYVEYDDATNVSTVTFTNPGWYVSPEQLWGIQNIHDLAGNIINPNPIEETSTPMNPPVTSAEVTGVPGLNNFYVSDVTVNLNTNDGDTVIDPTSGQGSEAATTYYKVDEGDYVLGNSVVVSVDGEHTVCYYSVDNAGNSEVYSCVSFRIDQTHPVITINSYNMLPTNQDINVTAITDEGVLNSDSNLFTSNGVFNFIAVDEAGNSTTKTVSISNIDKTIPILSLNGEASIPLTVGGLYTELGAFADDGSSVSINGTVNTAVAGTYTITYTSTDAAGNVAVPITRTITVLAAPVLFTTAGGEVLGDTTTEPPVEEEKGEVKGTEDKKDDFNWMQDAEMLGIAWYWWLIGGLAAAGIGWWFIAGFRRRDDN